MTLFDRSAVVQIQVLDELSECSKFDRSTLEYCQCKFTKKKARGLEEIVTAYYTLPC